MLNIVDAVTIRREVHIQMPRKGTGFDKHVLNLDFRIVDRDEQDDLQRRALDPLVRGEEESDEAWRARNEEQRELLRQYDRELLREAIVGWPGDKTSGLGTPDAPLPFTEENRERLVKNPIILAQLTTYYRNFLAGKPGLGKS